MRDYRLSGVDTRRRAMRIDDFEAGSDEHALAIARAMEEDANCQLWQMIAWLRRSAVKVCSGIGAGVIGLRRPRAAGHRSNGR